MFEIENFQSYSVDIADIWFCERSYFFSKEQDLVFASKLLEMTQSIITKYAKPAFGQEMRSSDESYYEQKYVSYVKSLNSIENQFALDYFFRQDKCFEYTHSIIITNENLDYGFWFILKLRQYDGKLTEINNFLKYQLKNNYKNRSADFGIFLKLNIKQYPELLSKRVIETTNDWIDLLSIKKPNVEKIKKKAHKIDSREKVKPSLKGKNRAGGKIRIKKKKRNLKIQKDEVKKPVVKKLKEADKIKKNVSKKGDQNLPKNKKIAQPIGSKKLILPEPNKKIKPKQIATDFCWVQTNPILKSKQLNYLRNQLIGNGWIDQINQIKFDSHFNGKIQSNNLINWLEKQYPLIYLIEKCKPFLSPSIYSGSNNSVSVAKFAQHFSWQGNAIHILNWNKVKSTSQKTNNIIYKSIDLIIKHLQDIT